MARPTSRVHQIGETDTQPIPIPTKRKVAAGLAAIFFPLGAAVGKAFGNAFGVICLILLFTAGITATTAITAAMLTTPILSIALACFIGVTVLSLGMEGVKNWQYFYELWTGDKKKKKAAVFTPPIPTKSNFFRKILGLFFAPFSFLIPLLGAIAKGATVAFGTTVTLAILFGSGGLPLLIAALVAGFAVMLVSLSKEGIDTFSLFRLFINWLMGSDTAEADLTQKKASEKRNTLFNRINSTVGDFLATTLLYAARTVLVVAAGSYFLLKAIAKTKLGGELLAWFFPMLSALGKGLGYSFGMVKLCGFFTGVSLLSPWNIPIVLIVGLCELCISLAFEGNELRRTSQRANNALFGISEEVPPPTKNSVIGQCFRRMFAQLPESVRYGVGYLFSAVAALAKGATMGFGTITTLSFLVKIGYLAIPLTFATPMGWVVLGTIGFCALSVALVSWTKEGKVFRKWATRDPAEAQETAEPVYQTLKDPQLDPSLDNDPDNSYGLAMNQLEYGDTAPDRPPLDLSFLPSYSDPLGLKHGPQSVERITPGLTFVPEVLLPAALPIASK